MTALALRNICFSYGSKAILDGASLFLQEGTVSAVTGDSGCGKSTLAMIACGIIPKSVPGNFTGRVEVFGEDISKKEIYETAGQISMVSQDPESQLFSPAVIDEVAFAPENLCFSSDIINKRIKQALSTVGMQNFADFAPDKLSGGQQQLIALASILTLDPRIIIFDEVTSQIDEQGVRRLVEVVRALKEQKKTILIIEHGAAFEELYDEKYVLKGGKLYRWRKKYE